MVKQDSIRVTKSDGSKIGELEIREKGRKTIVQCHYDGDGFLSVIERKSGPSIDLLSLIDPNREIKVSSITVIDRISVAETIEPRLISSISRSGRVYYQDDFEQYTAALTEKWFINYGAGGPSVLDTAFPFRGKTCAKIISGVLAGDKGTIDKPFGGTMLGTFGFEFWWFCKAGVANIRFINVDVRVADGANLHRANVRWVGTVGGVLTQKWQYLHSDGTFRDVPDGSQRLRVEAGDNHWHHFKFTFDLINNRYLKFVSSHLQMNLSTLPSYSEINTATPIVGFYIEIENETAAAQNLFVDDVVFTDSEEA